MIHESMLAMHTTDFGVVKFTPIETFVDPFRGLDAGARVDKLVEVLLRDALPRPATVGDWPQAHTAIRRSGLFVIETQTPGFTAMLRFNPDQAEAGDYEIHRRPRGGSERGRTTMVITMASDENDSRLSVLSTFPIRYAVVTVGESRPHARMIWLVGLRAYRKIDETAASE